MKSASFFFFLELIICRFFFIAILCSMSHTDKIKINDDFKEFFFFLLNDTEAQLKAIKFR